MAEYKKLFNVEITNTFYTNGISRDFDIVPLPRTTLLMKNNRLQFRKEDTGFRVFYQNEPGSDNPFIPFGDFDLRFALILKNTTAFQNITNLNDTTDSKNFETGNLVYFNNETQLNTDLEYSILDGLKASSFTYKFPQTGGIPTDNGEIEIKNEAGNDVTPTYPDPNTVKADDNGDFYYPVDFALLPAGIYTFTTTVNGINPEIQNLYIDNSLLRQPVFGIISIHVIDSSQFPSGRKYEAEFFRRETFWRYKMILKTSTVVIGDTLGIVDGDSVFTFARQTDETTNGIPTAVFDSNAEIPFTEAPRKKFRFVKNPGGGETIILNDLTNPPAALVSANGTDFSKSVIYITV